MTTEKMTLTRLRKCLSTKSRMKLIDMETSIYENRILKASIDLSNRIHAKDNWSPRWIK
jgi:hypothetical protein